MNIKMSVINKYILFVNTFIQKRALDSHSSFLDLTHRNIEQTPASKLPVNVMPYFGILYNVLRHMLHVPVSSLLYSM